MVLEKGRGLRAEAAFVKAHAERQKGRGRNSLSPRGTQPSALGNYTLNLTNTTGGPGALQLTVAVSAMERSLFFEHAPNPASAAAANAM